MNAVPVALATDGPAYPEAEPSAAQIAEQVYFVNHFRAVKNLSYGSRKTGLVLINRLQGGKPRIVTLERHLNNDYQDGVTRARDLAIFHSGKVKGTGILVQDYLDESRSLSFSLWLPALRKIRRHAEPIQSDSWGGSNFTYGDIYLRRPEDESHELLGKASFPDCLEILQLDRGEGNKYTRDPPAPRCDVKGRAVYRIKSSTRFTDWWYDHRVVWVDTETFADYRSDYYKDGVLIKTIDKDWRSMGLEDPRAQYWVYWYVISQDTGQQGMAYISPDLVKWNTDVDPKLWTERTLRKIKR